MIKPRRVLGDSWYARELPDFCLPLDHLIDQARPTWLFQKVMRVGVLRGLFAFWVGRSFDFLVTARSQKGCLTLAFLLARFGGSRKRLIVLEFLPGRGPRPGLRRVVYLLRHRLLVKPSFQRAVCAVHVLTEWEREHYANFYGIDASRFSCIPFPQRWRRDELPPKDEEQAASVVSSGRAACDWDTLFKAADGQQWSLTVICSKRDFSHVQELNRGGQARVRCEIPRPDHDAELRSAAVYVLCLEELEVSSGQVRIRDAIRAGTAIVATRTRGIEGYLVDQETALLVEPGNFRELREAIHRLLRSPPRRAQLVKKAFDAAGERTFEDYIGRVRAFVRAACREDLSTDRDGSDGPRG